MTERAKEQKTVDDVAGRIPVGNVLAVFGTDHLALPQLYIAAFTDRLASDPQQIGGGKNDDQGGDKVRDALRHGAQGITGRAA